MCLWRAWQPSSAHSGFVFFLWGRKDLFRRRCWYLSKRRLNESWICRKIGRDSGDIVSVRNSLQRWLLTNVRGRECCAFGTFSRPLCFSLVSWKDCIRIHSKQQCYRSLSMFLTSWSRWVLLAQTCCWQTWVSLFKGVLFALKVSDDKYRSQFVDFKEDISCSCSIVHFNWPSSQALRSRSLRLISIFTPHLFPSLAASWAL